MDSSPPKPPKVGHRFRGFLPVVVDVETGGFNAQTDALLEIAAVILGMDENGDLVRRQTVFAHVEPFKGANLEKASMEVNGIRIDNPLRLAKPDQVTFSAFGLREGHLFATLPAAEKAKDPLISACVELAEPWAPAPALSWQSLPPCRRRAGPRQPQGSPGPDRDLVP